VGCGVVNFNTLLTEIADQIERIPVAEFQEIRGKKQRTSPMADANVQSQYPQKTGPVWDDDLCIYNNPLPQWWANAFYATLVFSVIYWIYYPSWPLGQHFLPGFGKVAYVNAAGQQESWHWNARAKLLKETQDAALLQKPYLDKLNSLPIDKIREVPELLAFVMSAGKSLFADNCSACHPMITTMQRTTLFTDNCAFCHQSGIGKIGPALKVADDRWIYGGTYDKIEESISNGRHGYMPPFAEALGAEQIENLANYVLSLSGNKVDSVKAAKGDELFHSHTAACFYCHGSNAEGRQDIGSANLTDSMWLWANVPIQPDIVGKVAAVKQVINGGLNRGVMPAWKERLKPDQIRILTVYVHELGGGK
jgi:cytochrome c oxidase cbb3-type subunit 3